MATIPTKVSEAVRRLNPHLYGGSGRVGAAQPQPIEARALVRRAPARQGGNHRMGSGSPVVRVGIVACLGRELDGDNLIAGLKPLRDAIARSLGIDDNDKFVRWEYGQHPTQSKPHVLIEIELIR